MIALINKLKDTCKKLENGTTPFLNEIVVTLFLVLKDFSHILM